MDQLSSKDADVVAVVTPAGPGGQVTVHITATKYFDNPRAVVADGADNELSMAECSVRDLLSANGWDVSDTRTVELDPAVIEDITGEQEQADLLADEAIEGMFDED